MPLILSGNVASATAGGYEVANSCRFDNASNSSLSKTYSGDGNMKTWTVSMWVKLADLGRDQYFFGCGNGSSIGNYFQWDSNDNIRIYSYTSGMQWNLITTAKYRDISSFYHVVVRMDNTQGTETDRLRLYVNGTQVTSFGTSSYPSQNTDYFINDATYPHYISLGDVGAYVAEVFFCDGQSYAASTFGEFDEDSPTIWKPKDCKADLTFGTNGFYLDFADSGDLGDDESGNTNDYTESNIAATDQATDTPTNNFATMNPLNVPTSNAPAFAEGNLETESATTSGERFMGSSTIGVTAAKWYVECRVKVIDSLTVGVSPDVAVHAKDNTYVGGHAHDWSILPQSGNKYNNDSGSTHGDAFSVDDILMIALDLDNNNVYFGRNGNWFDGSGNADEAAPNSALSLTAPASTPEGAYFFACSDGGGSAKAKVHWNFGNPPYANSSSVADANGYGAFEYAPPSGYLALCTKNLGSDGG